MANSILVIMKKSVPFTFSLYIVFLLAWPLLSRCQDYPVGYAPMVPTTGYIITKSGDTIIGELTYGKFTENFMSEIKFTGPDGYKIRYSADDLSGMGICLTIGVQEVPYFGTIYWDHYECRPSPKKGIMIFMNKFTDGSIKVFMHRGSATFSSSKFVPTSFVFEYDGIHFDFSVGEGLTIGPDFNMSWGYFESRNWYSSYYVEKEGAAMIKVEKENYSTLWGNLFGDCAKISEEISKNPDLTKFKNFLLVAELYNQICDSLQIDSRE